MFYVLLSSDARVLRYPYTITDLKRDNPNTSFPSIIDEETAAGFYCFPVQPKTPPPSDYRVNLERVAVKQNSSWVEEWISSPATSQEIADRTAAKSVEVRELRNQCLAECDWTQLPDSPVDSSAWATYRQELRDISAQAGFPWDIQWPEPPV